ncbi:MAG TPA: hypothetical protein VF245_12705 [Solirubrobacterales bacterium]
MEAIVLVAAFLAFIAWRERQHALERAALSRRGGKPPAPVVSSRRRARKGKPEKARVISADDDSAFAEARGWTDEPDEPAPAEEDDD